MNIAATLTQREMTPQAALDAAIDEANGVAWRWRMDALTQPHVSVWLLLRDGAVVEGWMTRRFLGRPTFWTWEPRFCSVSQFLPGVKTVVLAGCVEPVAWAEMPKLYVLTPDGEHALVESGGGRA